MFLELILRAPNAGNVMQIKERNEEGMGEQERRDCSQSKKFRLWQFAFRIAQTLQLYSLTLNASLLKLFRLIHGLFGHIT